MLWENNCTTVVMLNTLSETEDEHRKHVVGTQFFEFGKKETAECERYWPNNDGRSEDYGMCSVTCTQTVKDESLSYAERCFVVAKDQWKRKVTQLQFLNWPESGIPENVQHVLNFRKLVVAERQKDSSLVTVHSSAGTGRTGTFIALDMLLKQVDNIARNGSEKELDVFDCVVNLRRQRENMVENVEQYKFIHHALSGYIAEVIRQEKEEHASEEKMGTVKQVHKQQDQLRVSCR